jgi:hypothetical protein
MIAPPLNHQAQQLWASLPDMFARAQDFLVSQGILRERVTITEAVKQAPAAMVVKRSAPSSAPSPK